MLVDSCCILFPFICSFHPRIKFHHQWRYFALPCLITASFFIAWDIIFTKMGIWSFNTRYVLGLSWFHLPLEEYLFFLCIPYACTFTYYCFNAFFQFERFHTSSQWLSYMLIVGLAAIALFHLGALYTSVTFLLLSLLLSILSFRNYRFMPAFYASFFVILIPFFISNGILTGTGPDEPVVIYNNNYNLGIRMATIPVEDTFYGMLLLLMNVFGFELLRKRQLKA